MNRSFTDRVFGGVCGGLGALLGINPWWLRLGFVFLALITLGAFAVLYLVLWWLIPQESPLEYERGAAWRLSLALLLTVAAGVGWFGRSQGWLEGPTGQDLYWPSVLLVASVVFFLRQVRV